MSNYRDRRAAQRTSPAILEFLGSANDATNAPSYNFTSQPLGRVVHGRRRVIVAIHYGAGAAGFAAQSINIGGVAGVIHFDVNVGTTNFRGVAFGSALMPASVGATGTINAGFSGGSVSRCAIGIWAAYGLADSDPICSSFLAQPIECFPMWRRRNGILLAALSSVVTGSGSGSFFSPLTQRYNVNNETTTQEVGADMSGAGPSGIIGGRATLGTPSGSVAAAACLSWL